MCLPDPNAPPALPIPLFISLDLPVHIYDIVADCSDNVPTRYLVNDACVLSGKPLVSASALRLEGQVRSTLHLNIRIQNIE